MNINFENKRILVTGGCQGIGKEICLRLSKYKGTVIALSNNKENLDKLSKKYPEIQTIFVDLLDWDATRAAVKTILPIDLLVNNAGIGIFAPCLTASPEDFDLTFGVNVRAMLNVSQVVGQNLVERASPGSIVNLSSQTSRGAIHNSLIYCSSKAAVNMLTKTMALELGPKNIRVNCVLPTVCLTGLGKLFIDDEKRSNMMKNRIPLDRFVEPNEIVDAVIFLLSDRSSMITGVELPIDGGFLAT
ncbi:L-xylulose reductase-like [Copidosoma floridanum]|uniref:L-xylulose reductase-like n=1 Tax=Copidosoma floridanum TaxID=29053 RepID=UPI0006C979F2|nr:L-xylulose reductase-like [Copidosoma floridanum]XP_023247680.1 L-xylulose reductase-like [Copidosoma floridanum]